MTASTGKSSSRPLTQLGKKEKKKRKKEKREKEEEGKVRHVPEPSD